MDPQNPKENTQIKQGIQNVKKHDEKIQAFPKQTELIKDNDYAVIYESEKYIKLTQLRAGDKFQTTDGAYRHLNFINQPWGQRVLAHNKPNQHVYPLFPKSTLITETLARKTQILYSMDNSAILLKLNVESGNIVVEAGTGSGSLSCAFSETLGKDGRLYTFQFNKQRAEITKQFFENLNKTNVTSTWRDVVNDGFKIEGTHYKADALFLDVPNPWAAITHAKQVLKKFGKICCFSPCIEQVQKTCDELRRQKFKKIQMIECLSRQFQINSDKFGGNQKNEFMQSGGAQQQGAYGVSNIRSVVLRNRNLIFNENQQQLVLVYLNTRQIDKQNNLEIWSSTQQMATINGQQTVSQEVRDEVFKELKSINKNNICIDCEKKNPKWASIHLGVHLCIDCAGKHRQYGVMYSFVKSTNLDKWNRKQLLFMQKGGNQRALQYLTKCGVISETHKHIDYKSPIVQRYKGILSAQVQCEIDGKPKVTTTKQNASKKPQKVQQTKQQSENFNAPKQIPNAEVVKTEQKGKKKTKKKVGKKIDLEDFDNLVLDDGVPIEEKQKIVKAYESSAKAAQTQNQQKTEETTEASKLEQPEKPVVDQPKQMTEQQSKQKLQQLKANQNVKSISSESFKDNSISTDTLKQNLNKFSGSSSISSNAFFGGQDQTEDTSIEKIKGFVQDTSEKIYNKLSSYWTKS